MATIFCASLIPSIEYNRNMVQQAKRVHGGEGFRRGFLLSTSLSDKPGKRERQRNAAKTSTKQVPSTALLELENKKDDRLLVLERDQLVPNNASPCTTIEVARRDRESAEEQLLTEVETTSQQQQNNKFSRIDISGHDLSMEESDNQHRATRLLLQTTSLSESLPVPNKEMPRPSWLLEDIEHENAAPLASSKTVTPGLKYELSRTLYRLRRKSDMNWRKTGTSFLSNHVNESFEWFFVWHFLIDSIIEAQNSSTVAALRLGACIVDVKIEPCVACLRSHQEEETRRRIMACMSVLQFCLSEEWSSTNLWHDMIDQVIPELRTIACFTPSKRTILAQKAFELTLEIVTVASKVSTAVQAGNDEQQLLLLLWGKMDSINDLLDQQLQWMGQIISRATNPVEKARCQCKTALVCEWKDVNAYYQRIIGDERETEESLENLRAWCRRLGGYQDCEIGSLCQTIAARSSLDAERIAFYLEQAKELSQNTPKERVGSRIVNECKMLVSGVVGWLVQKGKRLMDAVDFHLLSTLEANMLVLLENGVGSVASISFSGLYLLWASHDALPRDVSDHASFDGLAGLPASIRALLKFLRAPKLNQKCSQHVLAVGLLTNCLRAGGKALLERFVSEEDTELGLEILLQLLITTDKACKDIELCSAVSMVILSKYSSSAMVRNTISNNHNIFRCASTSDVIRRLVDLALLLINTNKTEEQHALLDSLLETLTVSLDQDNSQSVHHLIQSIRDIKEKQSIQKLEAAMGHRWRHSFLHEEQRYGAFAFGQMLLAIGHELIEMPSCTTTLGFFGYIAGDHFCAEEHGKFAMNCVFHATNSILLLCLTALERNARSDDVFQRLAPLLLLRRLPAGFFHIGLRQHDWYADERKKLLANLGKHLASYLEIPYPDGDTVFMPFEYSAEERRLVVEIAGRCLPLGDVLDDDDDDVRDYPSFSLFEAICRPAFAQAMSVLDTSMHCDDVFDNDTALNMAQQILPANAALFAVCCWLSYAPHDDKAGQELLNVADFVYRILRLLEGDNDGDHRRFFVRLEVMQQFHTGCIEFLALCFEKRLHFLSSSSQKCYQSVDSVEATYDGTSVETNSTVTISSATAKLFDGAFCAARGVGPMFQDEIVGTNVKIDLWNAFVRVAQQCPRELLVPHLRALLLPKLFDEQDIIDKAECGGGDGGGGEDDDDGDDFANTKQYLVFAARAQLAIVLLSRIETENCPWDDNNSHRVTTLLKSHQWTLNVLKQTLVVMRESEIVPRGLHDLQCSAIKLLLATVVSMEANNEDWVEERRERSMILSQLLPLEKCWGEGTRMVLGHLITLLNDD